MKRCPNCERVAVRTKDWACQWCGYPLISNSYRKVEMTFREVKEERMPRPPVTAMVEDEPESELEPEPEPVAEIELEPEVSQTGPEEEYESEPAVEMEPEPVIESEPEPADEPAPEETPKPKPRARRKPAAKRKSAVKTRTAAKTKTAAAAESTEAESATEAEPKAEPPKPARRARTSRAKSAPVAAPEAVQPDMEISVDDVLEDYEQDGAAAEARYGGKVLKVTGMIERVEVKDNFDIFFVTLNSQKQARMQGVRCVFDRAHSEELNRLETGQTVTIQGNFSGSLIDISLRDCFIAS